MNKTQNVALGGILTALSIVLLYLASILPAAKIGLCASAGVIPSIAVCRNGIRTGTLIYIASAILAFLVVPDKTIAFFYAAFFGLYTLIKFFIESIRRLSLEWVLKLLFFNCIAAALYFFGRELLGIFPSRLSGSAVIFLMTGNVAFIAYDIAFSKLIGFFSTTFTKKG